MSFREALSFAAWAFAESRASLFFAIFPSAVCSEISHHNRA